MHTMAWKCVYLACQGVRMSVRLLRWMPFVCTTRSWTYAHGNDNIFIVSNINSCKQSIINIIEECEPMEKPFWPPNRSNSYSNNNKYYITIHHPHLKCVSTTSNMVVIFDICAHVGGRINILFRRSFRLFNVTWDALTKKTEWWKKKNIFFGNTLVCILSVSVFRPRQPFNVKIIIQKCKYSIWMPPRFF